MFCSLPSFKAGQNNSHLSSYVGHLQLKKRYRDIYSRTRILGGFSLCLRLDVSSLSMIIKLILCRKLSMIMADSVCSLLSVLHHSV